MVGTNMDRLDTSLASACLVPDIHVQAKLIASCKVFVGSDSGLLHVAGTTRTPIVGVFTSVHPWLRLPYRARVPGGRATMGYDCIAVTPRDLMCLGCQARAPIPSTGESCERGDIACVDRIDPNDIVNAVLASVDRWPPRD
jgi:ADP-heptose:LPS heptosyltransferase